MNLTWHIVKKDLRRFRLPLLLWATLNCCLVATSWMQLTGYSDWKTVQEQQMYAVLLWFVTSLVGYVLVAAYVLEDPTLGTEVLWMTRPISGNRMLRAKMLGVFLVFMFLPAVVWLPWWAYCGFEGQALLGSFAATVLVQGMVALIAATVATLTGSSSRFLVVSLLLLVGTGVTGMVSSMRANPVDPEVAASRVNLVASCLFILGATVVWLSYRFRNRKTGYSVAAAGCILAYLLGAFWPWNLVRLVPHRAANLPGLEQASFQMHEAWPVTINGPGNTSRTQLRVGLSFRGLPAKTTVLSGRADVELLWPDGSRTQLTGSISLQPGIRSLRSATGLRALELKEVAPDVETSRYHQMMIEEIRQKRESQGVHMTDSGSAAATTEPQAFLDILLPTMLAQRLTQEHPRLSVHAALSLASAELLLEAPLQEGLLQSGRNVRLHVVELKKDKVKTDDPAKISHIPHRTATLAVLGASMMNVVQVFVLNRDTGNTRENTLWFQMRGIVSPAEYVTYQQVEIPVPVLWRQDHYEEAAGWEKQTTVAVVGYRYAGIWQREGSIEALTIKAKE